MNKGMLARWLLLTALGIIPSLGVCAAESEYPLDKAPINLKDKASLQRGAKVYVNYCLGCHGLQYTRYESVAKGIGVTNSEGEVLSNVVKQNLLFTGEKLSDPILTSMNKKDSQSWFGKAPPDLTLVARSKGVDWLYTYMRTFYRDPSKTWGVNNAVYPDVGMPHVLSDLQGLQEATYNSDKSMVESIQVGSSGAFSPAEYDRLVTDLVNFLDYVAEPVKLERKRIGVWVLTFLGVLLVFSYLLKREYWKDIK